MIHGFVKDANKSGQLRSSFKRRMGAQITKLVRSYLHQHFDFLVG